MRLLLAIVLSSGPVLADCPPPPDHAARQADLLSALRIAPGPSEAQSLNNQLWELWTDAPDEIAQQMLARGMEQRQYGDFLGARDTFDALVAYCPDYAEGYNQRAFASFLRQDFAAALVDLDMALALSPDHIGALSGKGLTLIGMGRDAEAQEALRAAVRLNPWLNERSLITGPLESDI